MKLPLSDHQKFVNKVVTNGEVVVQRKVKSIKFKVQLDFKSGLSKETALAKEGPHNGSSTVHRLHEHRSTSFLTVWKMIPLVHQNDDQLQPL